MYKHALITIFLTYLFIFANARFHHSGDLDFEGNLGIFVPLDAFANYKYNYDQGHLPDRRHVITGASKRNAVQLPSNLNEIAQTGTVVYTTATNCIVVAKEKDGARYLEVDANRCAERPNLKFFLDKFFKTRASNIDEITVDIIQTENLNFQSLKFEEGSVKIMAENPSENYRHTQTMIILSHVKLTALRIPIDSQDALTLENIEFELEGINKLGKAFFQHAKDETDVTIEITSKVFLIDEYILNWQLRLEDLTIPATNFNFLGFKGATAAGSTIKGVYNKAEGMQLLLKLSANDAGVLTEYGANARFLVYKPPNKPAKAAMSIEYETNVKIKKQLKQFTDYTFTAPHFLEDQQEKWVLSTSMSDIPLMTNVEYMAVYDGTAEGTIHKGANIYIHKNIKEALRNCDASATPTTGLPESGKALLRLHLGVLGVSTHLPSTIKADVFAILKCVTPGEVELPDALFSIANRIGFKVTELVVAPAAKKFIVTVVYPNEIPIFGPLKMVNVQISITKEGNDPWTIVARSGLTFGPNIQGNVKLSVNTKKEFEFIIRIAFMDVDGLFKAFGQDPFGSGILKLFKKYLNIGVRNFVVSVSLTFGDMNNARVLISGSPVMQGIPDDLTIVGLFFNPTAGEDEKRRFELPENGKGGLAWKPYTQSDVTAVSSAPHVSHHKGESVKKHPHNNAVTRTTSSRAVTFGIVYPYTRLDTVLKKMTGFNLKAPWLGEASIILLASTARRVRCSDPKTGQTRLCLKKKDMPDKKSTEDEEKGDTSSVSGTERLKAESKPSTDANTGTSTPEGEEGEKKKEKTDAEKEDDTVKKHFGDLAMISDVEVAEGVTVRANLRLPADCQDNGICLWMQNNLGNNLGLQLDGQFTTTQVSLTAQIDMKVVISPTAYLTGFKFQLKVGVTNSISIGSKFYITDLDVVVTAEITLSVGKLELRGTMASMVERPFGIQFLAVGDLLVAIGITFAGGLPAIQFGAQIWLGGFILNPETGKVESSDATFKFQGYMGLDPSDPNNNYFFVQSIGADLTIGNALKALGSDIVLPSQVAESGFIGNLIFSINLGAENKDIVEFGFSIPPGLKFEGKLRILGYDICVKFRFNHKTGTLYIKADFDPIDDWAGGLITLVRSETERSKGPCLLVDIDPSAQRFLVNIEGYANALGISLKVYVKIDDSGLEFSLEGNVWNVLRVQVDITITFGNGIIETFKFRGCRQFEMEKIAEAIRKSLDDAKKKAEAAFKRAQAAVTRAKGKVQAFRNSIGSMQGGIRAYQNRLRKRYAQIKQKKRDLLYSCKARCGKVCVPFFGWKGRCWRVWGRWVGCMAWDKCKWRANNIVCIAGCEISKGFKKFTLWADQLGIKITMGLTTIANGLLEMTKKLSYIGDAVLNATNGLLEFANTATKALIDLPATLASAIGNIISIHQFCIYGNFDPKDKSCVGMLFDVTLFGSRFDYDGSICLDTNAYGNLGKKTTAKKYPEVATIDSDTAKITSQEAAIKSNEANMDKEKANVKSKIYAETNKRYRRSLVQTEEEQRIHNAAYGPLPNHDLRNAESVSTLTQSTPWFDENMMKEYTYDIEQAQQRSFVEEKIPSEESKSVCKQQSAVLDRYSTIADIYHTTLKQSEETKQNYLRQKRTQLNHLNNLKEQIQQGLAKANMTVEEKADLAFWRDSAEANYESYVKQAEVFLKLRKRDNIETTRNNLNNILTKQRGMNLPGFLYHLDKLAVQASRRSNIDSPAHVEDAALFTKIHEQLYAVATEELSYRELAKHVDSARNALINTKRSSIPCAA